MTATRFRWFVIFLLFAITVVNYVDRAAISYAIPLIERQLGFSTAQSGGILGAFGLGYAVTTLPAASRSTAGVRASCSPWLRSCGASRSA